MIRLTGEQALARLTRDCKFPEEKARRILNIAWEFENKAEPCPGGYVHVYYHGEPGRHAAGTLSRPLWSVVEHIGPVTRKWGKPLVNSEEPAYTEGNTSSITQRSRRKTMPPRKNTRAKPAPEPETEEAAAGTSKLDRLDKYLTGKITPTLTDYAAWFDQNVADPADLDSDRLIALAVTFYGEFQASDFNKEQKATRKAERAGANGEADVEAEAEPAQPRGRGARTAAKPAAAKPGTARPRGKGRTTATSGAAVY